MSKRNIEGFWQELLNNPDLIKKIRLRLENIDIKNTSEDQLASILSEEVFSSESEIYLNLEGFDDYKKGLCLNDLKRVMGGGVKL